MRAAADPWRAPGSGRAAIAAFAISAAASLVYLLGVRMDPLPLGLVAKGLSVGVLGCLALLQRRLLLAVALLLSSLGDLLLEAETGFISGLAAFLCAHLVYTVLFVRRRAGTKPVSGQLGFSTGVLIYASGICVWLAPHTGAMLFAVSAYLLAITAMVIAAGRAGYAGRLVVCGACLFMLSDSLLAINRFVGPFSLSGILVWCTYYLGQLGITLGVLRERATLS